MASLSGAILPTVSKVVRPVCINDTEMQWYKHYHCPCSLCTVSLGCICSLSVPLRSTSYNIW